jgi:alpha-2-macroglobulin
MLKAFKPLRLLMKKNPQNSILKLIKSAYTTLFGKINWNKPSWLQDLSKKAATSPKLFWSTAMLSVLLFVAIGYGVHWYQHLPKPLYTTASITAPEITPNEENLVPKNLIINFGIQNGEFKPQSVAPLSNIGKNVTEGINISPKIPGTWYWASDSQLIFIPIEDWPAEQQYTIQCDKDFFAANTHLEHHDLHFSTQPFKANITEFKMYQDPVNPNVRNATATIEFNFPVNPESLEKNTQLTFQNDPNASTKPVSFRLIYSQNKRIAYLHSDTIKINDTTRLLKLLLDKNISSLTQTGKSKDKITKDLLIPDASSFLKVLQASASIVRNDKDRPEQILNIETTLGVNENEFNKAFHAYLLPNDRPATAGESEVKNYQWQNPGEVTNHILTLSTSLTKINIPAEHNYATVHSFKFSTETPRFIYIKIDKGMKGMGDFILSNEYTAIIPVPEYPKEISFLHKGSLLALGGEKKLSVLVRGVPAVQFEFARVLPSNINQLLTQTQGDFNNPYFINASFNEQNISQISKEVQAFNAQDPSKLQYTALDLNKYLTMAANVSGPQGLFLLKATGWDASNNVPLDVKASRMILITDLGLVVKDNNDGTHDVFVASITAGTPVPNATISILGKNGLPILSRVSDKDGHASFPSLKDFVEEKEPTVYIAGLNNDVSFIPFNNNNRQLNFSKFDIGGTYTTNQDSHSLSAYLFSDRGIYRPGDTVHVGIIVKQAFVTPQPAGLPLEITIMDPRGNTIKDEKLTLNETGFMNLDFTTGANAPTGQYSVNLYLVKDNHPQNLLGSTSIRVSEFQPDRMKITSHLLPRPTDGWISPVDLKAEILLLNLYGAPAAQRTINARLMLTPHNLQFEQFPDYVFADPLLDIKKPAKVFNETLNSVKTNDAGVALFDLNLERFEKATYELTFFAEGFEAEGGRSVTTQQKSLISPLPYLIGYKSDGDLNFIKQNSMRVIHFIGINPQLGKEHIKDLRIQLVSLHPVTTLVKKPDGTYQYQSIIQSTILTTNPFEIVPEGQDFSLPTQNIGDYSLSILGKDDTVLNQARFSVVGASQTPLAKNAELSVKLNKKEYKANDTIELQITAPYTGSGLITIERDKVYASAWFKTDTTNSVQTIQIPAEFQGNGYVNIAFIRDWNSSEFFMSPLSYAVQPFEVSHENHDIKIDLKTPKLSRPGEPLTIDYHSDKPGKIIIFAVDEGILQVSRYATPDPLNFFFEKRALEVLTQQTLDQIMPKFIQDRELSASGGDAGEAALAGRLNPFKRKTDLPVVYWSGIIDTDVNSRQLTYMVPDYYNGQLRIMAVAVSNDSIGTIDTTTQIKGDFIINPNVPTFVSPGDEFEVSTSIANNLKNSSEHAPISVDMTATNGIEIIGLSTQKLAIAEGKEASIQFRVRATQHLGSVTLHFKASSGTSSTSMIATLSVRPASAFTTQIISGKTTESKKALDVSQTLYPEYRQVNATLSSSPLIFIFGLERYLEHFPYGCTEQITSQALPLLAMNSQPWFVKDTNRINEKINAAIQLLAQRQMSNGGFSYWPGFAANPSNNFASVYAMQFLTEAKAQGFNVPNELFYNGISYLKELASQNVTSLESARIQAYAIYILTRNETVTTNYLTNLQLFLQKDAKNAWQNDITAIYIAASYQMLKSTEEANRILNQYKRVDNQNLHSDFYDSSIVDAQYLYILAKHFPERANQIGDTLLTSIVTAINNNDINTILSGYASLALSTWQYNAPTGMTSSFSITEVLGNSLEKNVPASNRSYQKVDLDTMVKQVIINNPNKQPYFYQLVQAGFDSAEPSDTVNQGIELFREYRDAGGYVVQSAHLGDEIEVHIQIRALDTQYLSNIVIEDLLPGGFEVVHDSIKADALDFSDVREDRVNFFLSIDTASHELIYKIKATNIGQYTVPPIYAESMYNASIRARGAVSQMSVVE